MGSSIGPLNISFNDLSLSLDASNTRSYSGSGNTVFDLIRNSTLTITSATFSGSGSSVFYLFANSGNITTSTNSNITSANSRTLSCWVYFTSKAIQSLMCVGANGAGTGWGIETTSTVFSLSKGNSGTITAATYNTGEWYNVVYVGANATANSLNVALYINGESVYTGTDTSINTTNAPLKLGTNPAGTLTFNGRIAQARVYNKALSQREVKRNFQSMKKRFGL